MGCNELFKIIKAMFCEPNFWEERYLDVFLLLNVIISFLRRWCIGFILDIDFIFFENAIHSLFSEGKHIDFA
jgi:hypothetical protein